MRRGEIWNGIRAITHFILIFFFCRSTAKKVKTAQKNWIHYWAVVFNQAEIIDRQRIRALLSFTRFECQEYCTNERIKQRKAIEAEDAFGEEVRSRLDDVHLVHLPFARFHVLYYPFPSTLLCATAKCFVNINLQQDIKEKRNVPRSIYIKEGEAFRH